MCVGVFKMMTGKRVGRSVNSSPWLQVNHIYVNLWKCRRTYSSKVPHWKKETVRMIKGKHSIQICLPGTLQLSIISVTMTTETWVLHAVTGRGWRTQKEGHLLSCQTPCCWHTKTHTGAHKFWNDTVNIWMSARIQRLAGTRGMTDRLVLSGESLEMVNKSVTEQYAPNTAE